MAFIRQSVLRDIRDTYATLGFAIPVEVDDALDRRAAWVEVAHLLRLHELDGPAGAHACARRSLGAGLIINGVFASLEQQALKLLGRRPQAFMRFFPGAYAMAVRGIGTASYADGVNGGRMDITGAPALITQHAGYRAGMHGTFEGLLERLGWLGDVVQSSSGTAATNVTLSFTMRWWRPSAATAASAR